jgi:hypothetical protein
MGDDALNNADRFRERMSHDTSPPVDWFHCSI